MNPANPAFRILVTGSRDWTDEHAIRDALGPYLHGYNLVIIHGDCKRGADAIADRFASDYGIPVERFPARWGVFGKSAGPRRNADMVSTKPDLCLAFIKSHSAGASQTAALAEFEGIPTRRFLSRADDVEEQ